MNWTAQDARETYNIAHWGGGYFDVGPAGTLIARPRRDPHGSALDLHTLAGALAAEGLRLPVLVRFTDILHDRVDALCGAFEAAMRAQDYSGRYTAVYPIKVNQQRGVVSEILAHGGGRVGLEAGSKPELLAVLALSRPGGVVICNGYKDREYIRLALIGQALGLRVHIVIEKLTELELVLAESAALGIVPTLGLRARLASVGAGKWQNTGGEKGKFGLSAAQTLALIERLRAAGRLDRLQLLHFHLGSQIANLQDIQRGLAECGRFFIELNRLGAPIRCVDVGGGLGVDYEGTRSRSFCSMNYSVADYAASVVGAIAGACREAGLPQPDLITESGRAMTAHHAVLVTNVIDCEMQDDDPQPAPPAPTAPTALHELWRELTDIQRRAPLEIHHEAARVLGEAQDAYLAGRLTLAERAQAEQIHAAISQRLRPLLAAGNRSQRETLDELNERLADKYFLNFSLFQSIPDVWALEQIFPIVPLHRLDEAPSRRGVIEDLTCDSDGRVDHFVGANGIEHALPLHPFRRGEPYLIGIFLVGAYQEILGDMHNLFGDTAAVNVALDGSGGFRMSDMQPGDTVDSVLRDVRYDADALRAAYQARFATCALDDTTRARYLAALSEGLTGYTYLED
jgi:arginine decarboxylase